MNKLSKIVTGAVAAALVTISAAAPAEARGRWGHRHDGVDAGDVIAGVAIVGGIAALASAIGNGNRGYGNAGGERGAVDACAYEAERRNGGQVSDITEVTRRDGYYQVRGMIDAGNYDSRGRGGYDDGRGYTDGQNGSAGFSCTVRDGRIYDFRVDSGYSR